MKLLLLLYLSTSVLCATDCGLRPSLRRSATIRPKRAIVDGRNVTSPGQWPWQVLVDSGTGLCGGTIIGHQWALTAAHCLTDAVASDVSLFADITRLAGRENNTLGKIVELIRHPNSDSGDANNLYDIALLKLESPIVYSEKVSSICLPSPCQSIPSNAKAVAIGFGNTNDLITGEIVSDGQLREVTIPIIPPDDCEKRWNAVFENSTIEQLDVVCASTTASGVHYGDSGGPLMMKASDGKWFQNCSSTCASTALGSKRQLREK